MFPLLLFITFLVMGATISPFFFIGCIVIALANV